jgi:hypothetical protein
MELDLTNVKVKDLNPKGKMKVRTPKCTNHSECYVLLIVHIFLVCFAVKQVLSPDEC